MKLQKVFLLLTMFAIVVVAIVFSFYSFYIVQEVISFETNVKVGSGAAFNLDNDKAYFGTIKEGSVSKSIRQINYTNPYDFPVEISVFFKGEMAPWLSSQDQNMDILPGETGVFVIDLFSPPNLTVGNYTGVAKVYVRRVLW